MKTQAELQSEAAEIAAAQALLEVVEDGPARTVQDVQIRSVVEVRPDPVEVKVEPKVAAPAPVEVVPVAEVPVISEVDRLAQDRLSALSRKRAPVRAAPVEHPEATTPPPKAPEPKPPTDPLDFNYLFAEAKRRGVDPRTFVLDALDVVQAKKAAPKYERPAVLSEIDELKKQIGEERAAREKLEHDIGVAGSDYAEQQRREVEANTDAQILAAAGRAFVGDQPETVKAREAFPRAAKQKPGWVAQYVLGAVKSSLRINAERAEKNLPPLRLTTETIFASMENELKELGVEPAPVNVVAPATESLKAAKVAPKSPEAAPRSTTTQGSFAVPRGLEGLKLRPGEPLSDLEDQARAASLLESAPD